MVQADARLSSSFSVAKLDAELVTRVFRELAAKANGSTAGEGGLARRVLSTPEGEIHLRANLR
jgi:hypothetical protein